MDPQFQSELTLAIVTLAPGIALLSLLALGGLLMLLEKSGILAPVQTPALPKARVEAAAPAAAASPASAPPTAEPGGPAAPP